MRHFLFAAFAILLLVSCSKDQYTSVPQITFKSITNTRFTDEPLPPSEGAKLTIEVTDKEGDLGFKAGSDSAYIFIKQVSVLPNKIDSIPFPSNLIRDKNFKGEAEVVIESVLPAPPPSGSADTLYFEVYVTDFAKHKSNVIRTAQPLYYITP